MAKAPERLRDCWSRRLPQPIVGRRFLPILKPAEVDALLEQIDAIEPTRNYSSVTRKPNDYKEISQQTPAHPVLTTTPSSRVNQMATRRYRKEPTRPILTIAPSSHVNRMMTRRYGNGRRLGLVVPITPSSHVNRVVIRRYRNQLRAGQACRLLRRHT